MNELKRVNEIVNTTNIVDFRIQSFNSVDLSITGSFDFCYYHEVELIFHEVSYISLPADFSYPIFRVGKQSEFKKINKLTIIDDEEILFCIEAETSSSIEKIPFYIVAEKVSLIEGTVLYDIPNSIKK